MRSENNVARGIQRAAAVSLESTWGSQRNVVGKRGYRRWPGDQTARAERNGIAADPIARGEEDPGEESAIWKIVNVRVARSIGGKEKGLTRHRRDVADPVR